jgi:hypothetical protein
VEPVGMFLNTSSSKQKPRKALERLQLRSHHELAERRCEMGPLSKVRRKIRRLTCGSAQPYPRSANVRHTGLAAFLKQSGREHSFDRPDYRKSSQFCGQDRPVDGY